MKLRIIIVLLTLFTWLTASAQDKAGINLTDAHGHKQGKWIKYYPNGVKMYEGSFTDDHPVGEFRRYDEDGALKSLLIYSSDGLGAEAEMYHANGFPASKGKYVDKKKEGVWKFYSSGKKGMLIGEENYAGNKKTGYAFKYYPDGSVAEKIIYKDDKKNGEWIQYHHGGKLALKSSFVNGLVEGKYQAWYENGQTEFLGQYKYDVRDGEWIIYNKDGSVKYRIEYVDGIARPNKYDNDASDYLDSLEKNKSQIEDPEKTGILP